MYSNYSTWIYDVLNFSMFWILSSWSPVTQNHQTVKTMKFKKIFWRNRNMMDEGIRMYLERCQQIQIVDLKVIMSKESCFSIKNCSPKSLLKSQQWKTSRFFVKKELKPIQTLFISKAKPWNTYFWNVWHRYGDYQRFS